MPKCVIQYNIDGGYIYTDYPIKSWRIDTTTDLQKARVFANIASAKSALLGITNIVDRAYNFEIVPVELKLK